MPPDFMQGVYTRLARQRRNQADRSMYVAVRRHIKRLHIPIKLYEALPILFVSSSCRYAVQTWTEKSTRWTIKLFGFGLSIPQALPSPKKLGPMALLILPEANARLSQIRNIENIVHLVIIVAVEFITKQKATPTRDSVTMNWYGGGRARAESRSRDAPDCC